jgi:hypothetical protein
MFPTLFSFELRKFIIYVWLQQGKIVPKSVMEVLDEELNKLSFLEGHSSEFK